MRITILGMGRMGAALAVRLIDTGHDVTVWNRTREKALPLAKRGATLAETLPGAVDRAEVVITILSDDRAVREVVSEVIPALPAEAILVDSSTVSPDTSRWLAEQTPRFVAAPILGHPVILAGGQAQVLLGGPEDVIEHLSPLWSDMASRSIPCGAAPSATTMKLLSNLLLIGSVSLMSEAVATAQANGIEDDLLRRVFGESPVIGPGVRNRLEDVMAGDHQGLFTVALAEKDMRLALDLAAQAHLTLLTAEGSRAELLETEALGRGEDDLGAVVEAVRRPAE